jgi:hypothetical protein
MQVAKILAATTVAAFSFAVAVPKTQAQISVNIGPAPSCPYGYYEAPPYNCAPYGYYGPEWFSSGVFIGAGPWYHGPEHFYGHVDNHYHPEHGYHGPYPTHGEAARPEYHVEHNENFHGNEIRDGRGHVGGEHH